MFLFNVFSRQNPWLILSLLTLMFFIMFWVCYNILWKRVWISRLTLSMQKGFPFNIMEKKHLALENTILAVLSSLCKDHLICCKKILLWSNGVFLGVRKYLNFFCKSIVLNIKNMRIWLVCEKDAYISCNIILIT